MSSASCAAASFARIIELCSVIFVTRLGTSIGIRWVNQTKLHAPFRLIFGDERQSYEALLQAYHARTDYSYDRQGFISEYATSHPWEDWAETFAHFLHIVSTLETASELRLSSAQPSHQASIAPYQESNFDALLSAWTNVTYTMNELNRSMGLGDGYPFEISSACEENCISCTWRY
jgi:hypothetical protein